MVFVCSGSGSCAVARSAAGRAVGCAPACRESACAELVCAELTIADSACAEPARSAAFTDASPGSAQTAIANNVNTHTTNAQMARYR